MYRRINALSEAVCLVNRKGKALYCNTAFSKLYTEYFGAALTAESLEKFNKLPLFCTQFIKHNYRTGLIKQAILHSGNQSYLAFLIPSGINKFLFSIKLSEPQTFVSKTALYHYIHDLKSPLATALLAVENLEIMFRRNSDEKEISEVFFETRQAIKETNEQIQKLVLFTRNSQNYLSEVNLTAFMESVLDNIHDQPKINFSHTGELPTVFVDKNALGLALETLIKMALHYKIPETQLNVFVGRASQDKGLSRLNNNIEIKIFSGDPDHSIFNKNELIELELKDKIDLLFIRDVLINQQIELKGGIDQNRNIFWSLLILTDREA